MKFATLSIMDHHPIWVVQSRHSTKRCWLRSRLLKPWGFIRCGLLNITSAITAVAQRRQFYWLQPHSAPGGFVGGGPDRCIRLIKRLEQWGVRRFLAIMN
jgi:hypothetical protein